MLLIRRGFRIWFTRYLPAEIVGTSLALALATYTFFETDSYLLATAMGLAGEGFGFYGFIILRELIITNSKIKHLSPIRRFFKVTLVCTTNLLIEFTPAEILNTLFVRPVLLYLGPQYIHPYPLGFFLGKFGSDVFFYTIALCGYGLNHVRRNHFALKRKKPIRSKKSRTKRRASTKRKVAA